MRQGPLVEPPSAEELPPLDRSNATVNLEDVHFDTFDGGSIALSNATPEQIEDLRDRIPPIAQPRYERATDAGYIEDGDLTLGYVTDGGEAFAYPVKILNFHEIVNQELDGAPVLISYSYWWQIAGRAIVGPLSGAELSPLPSTTTTRDHPNGSII